MKTLPERLNDAADRLDNDRPVGPGHREAIREAAERLKALEAALRWAMATGHLSYSQRIPKQNDAYCDAVDRARALLEQK